MPAASAWWLEHYPKLERYLDDRYRRLVVRPDACAIYELSRPPAAA